MPSTTDDTSMQTRVIPLAPHISQHTWGKRGPDSLAARLYFQNSCSPLSRKEHYSELCIGTHAETPTRIAYDHSLTLLDHIRTEVIEVDANKVEHYARLHKSGLPFLFKIISVASPQALHVHPDNADSVRLHKSHPELYPDTVGRAEMVVALSTVDALLGFRTADDIVSELARVPEFADAVGRLSTDNFVKVVKTGRAGPNDLRTLFASFMNCAPEKVVSCLRSAVKRFSKMPDGSLTSDDTLLLSLHAQFPNDPMCFCVYFLNRVTVESGSAVLIHPKEPHAYLLGDMIEISSCSINVVRAGLTSLFLDKKEFVNLLTYDDSPVEISVGEEQDDYTTAFLPPVDEFLLYRYDLPSGKDLEIKLTLAPSIIVCLSGEGYISELEHDTEKMLPLCTGIIYYLKASTRFLLSSSYAMNGTPSANLLVARVTVNETVEPGSSCIIS